MLSSIDVETGITIIITSANCTSQYKSTHNFFDLQRPTDQYECAIICIHGVASHVKNEVDAVGGITKIAIRNAVMQGKSFLNANDCIEFLKEKFEACDSPSYSIKLIDAEKLNEERAEVRYKRCSQ